MAFLRRRVRRIYPLYWCYTFAVAAVFWYRPAWVNASQEGRFDLVSSLLLLPMEGLPVLMVGWTLIFEIYFYLIIAAMIGLLPERRFLPALLAWGALVAIGSILLGDRGGPWLQVAMNPMALEFIAGSLIAIAYYRGRLRLPWPQAWAVVASVGSILAYCLFQSRTGQYLPGPWARTGLFGIPAAVLVCSLLQWEREGRISMPGWLVKIGDASYSIYLSHVLTLSALGGSGSASPSLPDTTMR